MRNILILIVVFAVIVNAQTGSINNTLGTGGSFIVKDGANNYLRVDQSTGNAIILRNLELGADNTSSLSSGNITKNGVRFLHNYRAPDTDGNNTFLGIDAGNFTFGGGPLPYYASQNTGVGAYALNSLTTGYYNAAFGSYSLFSNTTGGQNTAMGSSSLSSNTIGIYNSAFGSYSLYQNTAGDENSAFGYNALYHNSASFNTAFGSKALLNNTTGETNTALGIGSLLNNTSGSNNTAIGNIAGSSITSGNNNIAIGFDAQVPGTSWDNQVRIGNAAISYAGIQVAWSITSDKRWKENINPSDLGLEFISKLNPVLYTRINDVNQKIEYGLIAQELEQVLKEEGVVNSAMLTIDGDGRYELRYNDLLAPMIKAIQELKNKNDQLRSEVESLNSVKQQLADIESLKEELAEQIKMLKENNERMNTKFSSIDN